MRGAGWLAVLAMAATSAYAAPKQPRPALKIVLRLPGEVRPGPRLHFHIRRFAADFGVDPRMPQYKADPGVDPGMILPEPR